MYWKIEWKSCTHPFHGHSKIFFSILGDTKKLVHVLIYVCI